MTLQHLFLVFLGGGTGAVLRFLVSVLLGSPRGFPWATLCVNLLGCALSGWLAAKYAWPQTHAARVFFVVGLLGGFTTFSAFAWESLHMLQRGNVLHAVGYVSASVLGGLAIAFAGFCIGR